MTVRTVSHASATSQRDLDQHDAKGAGTAEPAGQHGDDDESHHFTIDLDVNQESALSQNHEATFQFLGIVVWIISLYHMTGEHDIVFDLANYSDWDAIPAGTKLPVQTVVETDTTPLQLLSHVQTSLAKSETKRSTSGESGDDEKQRHVFMLLDEISPESKKKTSQLNQNSSSCVRFGHVHDKPTLSVHWPDISQDRDELVEMVHEIASFVISQSESPISSMQGPASGQLHLAGNSIRATASPDAFARDDQTIHGLFDRTCSSWSSRQAVDAWDGCFTYAELDAVSWRWANVIASWGDHAPGERVLHVFDHSLWAIVAWFALFKAGCACVPVDASAPEERIKYILQRTGCRRALCDATRAPLLQKIVEKVLTPDDLDQTEASYAPSDKRAECDGSSSALIMFTSGSSGDPKGVVQSHAAVASSLVRVAEALELDENTRSLQFASHSFDASISEIFAPLSVGGCIVIPHPDEKLGDIAENINAMRVSHALLTPTVASTFSPDDVSHLQSLSLGGEKASTELRTTWAPKLDLRVLYGTTETAVWDTVAHVTSDDCNNSQYIGRPIGGRIWVVHPNDWTTLSPIGVPGELCVQGPEIADCYLEAPELTAQAFKSEPAWLPRDDSGSGSRRIYRTGDVGRVLKDGSLELRGRMDRQIKLNGQRMEPAEIEEALTRCMSGPPGVHVDVLHPDEAKPLLAAFVSCGEDSDPGISQQTLHRDEMQKALKEVRSVLPRTMVPSLLVPLTTFPMTVSKKINRPEMQKLGLQYLSESRQSRVSSEQNDSPKEPRTGRYDTQSIVQMILDFSQDDQSEERHSRPKDISLDDAGLDSLDAVEVSSTLKKTAQMNVPASTFLKPGIKISDIAGTSETSEPEENPETRLKKQMEHWKEKLDRARAASNGSVLLTGASGFLGKEILRQLLEHSEQWTVICLVRGHDRQQARDRLLENLKQESWWTADFENRLDVWAGDLAYPFLGLQQDAWGDVFGLDDRPRRVHTIIHNGAKVNWLDSFDSLADINVGSTAELLMGLLQAGDRDDRPDLIYVSGGYISGPDETPNEMAHKISRLSGYDQTKFVSESMISHFNTTMAPSERRRVRIVKPGFITCSAKDDQSQAQTRDALWRFVKACVQVGCYSKDDAQNWIPVSGVDTIASMVVAQMPIRDASRTEKRFHEVLKGVFLQDVWKTLAELGIKLEPLGHQEWLEKVNCNTEAEGREHPLFPLMDWFLTSEGYMGIEPPTAGSSSDVDKDIVDEKEVVKKSLEQLIQCGYLEKQSDSRRSPEQNKSEG